MYKIFHNVDGVKITTLNSDAEFIHFMRKIAVENDDEELSITCVGEAKDYLNEYCENLTLVDEIKVKDFFDAHGIEVQENEPLHMVELMMDNHKCVKWVDKQFYIPEDATYSPEETKIYDMLVYACHV